MKQNKRALRNGRKNSTYPKKKAFLDRENARRRASAETLGISYEHVMGFDYPTGNKPWK